MLLLHLVPDGERRLDARLDFVFEPHLVEGRTDGRREVAEEFVALCLRLLQLLRDVLIDLRVLIAKTEVLQFGLHLVEAQAVGQRRIDIERLSCYLILLVGRLRGQRAHIVQAVADLDEDDADVVVHREEQLLEVFCLSRSLVAEDATRDLGQSVHNLCDLRSEDVLDVLHRVVGILHDVVEQGRADARGSQSDLLAGDLRHGYRVHNIWLARETLHALVRLAREVESLGDDPHLLSVARGQVGVEKVLESVVHHCLLLCRLVGSFLLHRLLVSSLLLDGLLIAGLRLHHARLLILVAGNSIVHVYSPLV